jgi:hypothetical protein
MRRAGVSRAETIWFTFVHLSPVQAAATIACIGDLAMSSLPEAEENSMETNRTSLAALGRAHVAFCEQLAWFALESLERAHRLNMDALEAFWERRIGEAKAAAGIETPEIAHRCPAAAVFLHWARASETVMYLSEEFGRLAAEYVAQMRNAALAEPALRERGRARGLYIAANGRRIGSGALELDPGVSPTPVRVT